MSQSNETNWSPSSFSKDSICYSCHASKKKSLAGDKFGAGKRLLYFGVKAEVETESPYRYTNLEHDYHLLRGHQWITNDLR
jgi:hypothetical protein